MPITGQERAAVVTRLQLLWPVSPGQTHADGKYSSSSWKAQFGSAPGAAPQGCPVFPSSLCALAALALRTARAREQALRCPSPQIKLQSPFPGSTLENIKGWSQSSLPGDEAAAAYSV